jgi:hypothetical protein
MLSRGAFSNCNTLHDVVDKHGPSLVGEFVLVQCYGTVPEDTITVSSPIDAIRENSRGIVMVITQNIADQPQVLNFAAGTKVVSAVEESDDVWFSPNNYERSCFGFKPVADEDITSQGQRVYISLPG